MELKKKKIVHKACSKEHVDRGYYAEYNHSKHLCEYCRKYFYDKEKAVGV